MSAGQCRTATGNSTSQMEEEWIWSMLRDLSSHPSWSRSTTSPRRTADSYRHWLHALAGDRAWRLAEVLKRWNHFGRPIMSDTYTTITVPRTATA